MTPDVIVVGAGLAGLATAWHLAADHRVLVVDQARAPGAEASSQNAGMVRQLGEDPFERTLAVRTAAWMRAPGEHWAGPPPAQTVGALLGLVVDEHFLTDAAAHLEARGVAIEAIDPDRAREVAPATAGTPLRRAWWLPHEQVADSPALLTGFLAGLRAHGGELRLGIRVETLLEEGGRVVGLHTDAGPLRAPLVVLAAGAWAGILAARSGLARPLIPLRRSMLRTAPHPLARPRHPWVWLDDVGLYARPEEGRWLVSACEEEIDLPAEGPGSRGEIGEEHRQRTADKLQEWLPTLRGVALEEGWTGLRTFAPDRRPILGEDPERPGLWWAAGLGGYGVTCCYGVGEALAAWIRGQPTPWLRPSAVSPGRAFLRRWPIRPRGDIRRSRMASAYP